MVSEKKQGMFGRWLAVATLTLAVFAMALGSEAEAKTYKLTYSTYFNPSYTFIHQPMVDFAKKVETRTNGQVKIQIYHSAQLYKAKEELAACERGDIDITNPLDTYSEGIIPEIGVGSLPFLFKDNLSMQRTLDAGLWEPGVRDALDKHNLILLGAACAGGYQVYSKEPVTSPEQFKGKIWGVSGSTPSKTAEALGGSPTTMSSGELYLALQRGTIDGCTRPLVTGAGRKLYEVVKHMTMTNMYFCNNFLVINKDTWNSLPIDFQNIIKQCARERDQQQIEMLVEYEKGIIDLYHSKGVEVHILNDKEMEAFRTGSDSVRDWWLSNLPSGKSYIDFALKHQ